MTGHPDPLVRLVARIIDPSVWEAVDRRLARNSQWSEAEQAVCIQSDCYQSLAKARQILALSDPEVRRLREALEPFARLTPSSLYPADGSEAEAYVVVLATLQPVDFTGADLARARAARSSQILPPTLKGAGL